MDWYPWVWFFGCLGFFHHCCILTFSQDSIFWTGISTFWANKYLFLNLSYLALRLHIIFALLGSMSSRDIKFYLIMCIHTYCRFHHKPGHVSAIRKGRNNCLSQTTLRQNCLLNSMSHFPLIVKSLLWPCLSLEQVFFYCGYIFSLQRWYQLLLLSEHYFMQWDFWDLWP